MGGGLGGICGSGGGGGGSDHSQKVDTSAADVKILSSAWEVSTFHSLNRVTPWWDAPIRAQVTPWYGPIVHVSTSQPPALQ